MTASTADATRRSGSLTEGSGAAPETLPIEPLDREVFGVLVDLDVEEPGFLAELIAEFQSGVVKRMAAMHQAVRTGDAQALGFAAHAMRGSCGTLGAKSMASIARRLEDLPPGETKQGWSLVHRLEAEYEAVIRALDLAPLVPGPRRHASPAPTPSTIVASA